MRPLLVPGCLLATLLVLVNVALATDAALRPWPVNPWYWSRGGDPVLLLGGSDDDNLFQWPERQLVAQLDRLQQAGGNYLRNTMSDRPVAGFEVYPYHRRPDGRYDLRVWNDAYWQRLERLLVETARRGMVVQIEVWDRFDYTDFGGDNFWRAHPYNPRNNVNYTSAESGLQTEYPDHPGLNRQPFFFTTPGQRRNRILLFFQERFVDKLLAHTLRYDHVLYCLDNETNGEPAWSHYWARYIRERARSRGRTVQLTEMWGDWRLGGAEHRHTFDHPELYDFVEVSQNTHNRGQRQWDELLAARRYLASKPRPMNTVKTYGADGGSFGQTDQDGVERFWRQLLGGSAAVRFHRPPAGLGLNDTAVASLRAARRLASLVALWSVRPANELLAERVANEAYLASDGRAAHVLYFPAGGRVRLDLRHAPEKMMARWIDIATGDWGPTGTMAGGDRVEVSAPGPGSWVVAITPAD